MASDAKIRVCVGNFTIEVEGNEAFVEKQFEFVKNEILTKRVINSAGEGLGEPRATSYRMQTEPVAATKRKPRSVKEFFNQKQPKGHKEIVTVFAYHLKAFERKSDISEEDIKECYRKSDTKMPKFPIQAIRDAKNQRGYFESGTKRGLYVISDHGEEFVKYDLPRKVK